MARVESALGQLRDWIMAAADFILTVLLLLIVCSVVNGGFFLMVVGFILGAVAIGSANFILGSLGCLLILVGGSLYIRLREEAVVNYP